MPLPGFEEHTGMLPDGDDGLIGNQQHGMGFDGEDVRVFCMMGWFWKGPPFRCLDDIFSFEPLHVKLLHSPK